jgi:hypothetical protein
MTQYRILRELYERTGALIAAAGEESGLFRFGLDVPDGGTVGSLVVSGLGQVQESKGGEFLVLGDRRYEYPSLMELLFRLVIRGVSYADVLEAAGLIVRTVKDCDGIPLPGYGWHGCSEEKCYLEPMIGSPVLPSGDEGSPVLSLFFRVRCGVNSGRGVSFRRVEKRDFRTSLFGGS